VSEQFHGCLVVQVRDLEDGEFLLVEAAENLPRWVGEGAQGENRAFLVGGAVDVVGDDLVPRGESSKLSQEPDRLAQVLEVLVSPSREVSPLAQVVDRVVRQKIALFCTRQSESLSAPARVVAQVPRWVAQQIQGNDTAAARALQAFLGRDALETKDAEKQLSLRRDDVVLVPLLSSRSLLFRVLQDTYHGPSSVFGEFPSDDAKELRMKLLGDRLALGFQIALCTAEREVGPLLDLDSLSKEEMNSSIRHTLPWKRYLQALQEKGYFRGQLPGSLLWQRLESQAIESFASIWLSSREMRVPCDSFESFMIEQTINFLKRNRSRGKVEPVGPTATELVDSDVTLTEILTQVSFAKTTPTQDQPLEASKVSQTISRVRNFMDWKSGFDGVDMPNDSDELDLDIDKVLRLAMQAVGQDPPSTRDEKHCGQGCDGSLDDADDWDDHSDANDARSSSKSNCSHEWSPANDGVEELDNFMAEVMHQMDLELSQIGFSLERPSIEEYGSGDTPPLDTGRQQLNEDLNLVENLVASIDAQQLQSGPAGNLLGSLGIDLMSSSRHKPI